GARGAGERSGAEHSDKQFHICRSYLQGSPFCRLSHHSPHKQAEKTGSHQAERIGWPRRRIGSVAGACLRRKPARRSRCRSSTSMPPWDAERSANGGATPSIAAGPSPTTNRTVAERGGAFPAKTWIVCAPAFFGAVNTPEYSPIADPGHNLIGPPPAMLADTGSLGSERRTCTQIRPVSPAWRRRGTT